MRRAAAAAARGGGALTWDPVTDWRGGQMDAARFSDSAVNETPGPARPGSRGRITDAPKSGMNCQRRQIRY